MKQMVLVVGAMACASLAACGPSPEEKRIADFVVLAKAELESNLFDPESAQYRNLRAGRVKDSDVVCGDLNARNRMGGYVGFKPFVAMTKPNSETIVSGVAERYRSLDSAIQCEAAAQKNREWHEVHPNDYANQPKDWENLGCDNYDYDFWQIAREFCPAAQPIEDENRSEGR